MNKKREELLTALERLSGGGELDARGLTSMSDVCRSRLGASPADIDEILLEELGLDGEEFYTSLIDIGNKIY